MTIFLVCQFLNVFECEGLNFVPRPVKDSIGAACLALALEIDLAILIEISLVGGDAGGDAGVEDGVEPVPVAPSEVEPHQFFDLAPRVDLIIVERALQVVELVGVGLLA